MKTTATNRKIRELLTQLRDSKLEPRPEFQRRLVWSNKDKCAFIETVLLNYPFPEIYVAAGAVDVETGEAKEMLVDGQQRITTLYQYFVGSKDLKLSRDIQPYSKLSTQEKENFLQYDVVVRDLGKVEIEQIREVFRRINATRYSLNAMEIHNARYEGEYKNFAEQIAQKTFFEKHQTFSPAEIRRMQDTRFALSIITTVLSTYFNRDDEIEDYLQRYNDEFPLASDIEKGINRTIDFIDGMSLPSSSRAWQKADLFTLIVELYWALNKDGLRLDPATLSKALLDFYAMVDSLNERGAEPVPDDINKYYRAALQATNDRGNRLIRGEVLRKVWNKETAVLTTSSKDTSTDNPCEFLDYKDPQNKVEQFAVIARFRELREGITSSMRDDFEAICTACGIGFERDKFSDDMKHGREAGLFSPDGSMADGFPLSAFGQKYVDLLPDRDAIKALKKSKK